MKNRHTRTSAAVDISRAKGVFHTLRYVAAAGEGSYPVRTKTLANITSAEFNSYHPPRQRYFLSRGLRLNAIS